MRVCLNSPQSESGWETYRSFANCTSIFFLTQASLFVANLPFRFNDDDLAGLFEGIVELASAQVVKEDGRSRGFGFADVKVASDAQVRRQRPTRPSKIPLVFESG